MKNLIYLIINLTEILLFTLSLYEFFVNKDTLTAIFYGIIAMYLSVKIVEENLMDTSV